jgi:hypothetical protein
LGWICHAAARFIFHGKEGGIQVLAGLAPSGQTAGSLLRTPWLASGQKNSVKLVSNIHFNGKTVLDYF